MNCFSDFSLDFIRLSVVRAQYVKVAEIYEFYSAFDGESGVR